MRTCIEEHVNRGVEDHGCALMLSVGTGLEVLAFSPTDTRE